MRSRQPQAAITGLFKEHQTFQRSSETGGPSLNVWMSAGMTGRVLFSEETVGIEEQKKLP